MEERKRYLKQAKVIFEASNLATTDSSALSRRQDWTRHTVHIAPASELRGSAKGCIKVDLQRL